jgi:uncharacterized protein
MQFGHDDVKEARPMHVTAKCLSGWWIAMLLSVPSFAASSNDLRLLEAVKNGKNEQAVRSLLEEHADPNTSQADGATALAWAVHLNDLETAGLLIRAGANVNKANDYGATPLWLACSNRNAAIVEMLLEAGANPNAALASGETPLMSASQKSIEIAELLLAHGADANAKENTGGQTALMWALAERQPEIARVLIEHGADINARSKSSFTPLHFAAQKGDLDSAKLLQAKGADVNAVSREYSTPLVVATTNGQQDVALFLLENGADPNVVDAHGFTVLHYAAATDGDKLEMLVKALLAHGANPNVRSVKIDGVIPVVEAPVGSTPFFLATDAHNLGVMRILADGGADPLLATTKIAQSRALQSVGNTTPLMMAAGLGRYLNIAPEYTEEEEKSALEAAKLAVELGADVNAANEYGWTALHIAAYMGANTIIQFLVDKGAKIDVMDNFGQTPLSIASRIITVRMNLYVGRPRKFRESTANLLLKLGATPLAASGVQAALIQ